MPILPKIIKKLLSAAKNGDVDTLESLCDAEKDHDYFNLSLNNAGETVLMVAIANHQIEFVKHLLENRFQYRINLHIRNAAGNSVVTYALENADLKTLLRNTFLVDMAMSQGECAAQHYAAFCALDTPLTPEQASEKNNLYDLCDRNAWEEISALLDRDERATCITTALTSHFAPGKSPWEKIIDALQKNDNPVVCSVLEKILFRMQDAFYQCTFRNKHSHYWGVFDAMTAHVAYEKLSANRNIETDYAWAQFKMRFKQAQLSKIIIHLSKNRNLMQFQQNQTNLTHQLFAVESTHQKIVLAHNTIRYFYKKEFQDKVEKKIAPAGLTTNIATLSEKLQQGLDASLNNIDHPFEKLAETLKTKGIACFQLIWKDDTNRFFLISNVITHSHYLMLYTDIRTNKKKANVRAIKNLDKMLVYFQSVWGKVYSDHEGIQNSTLLASRHRTFLYTIEINTNEVNAQQTNMSDHIINILLHALLEKFLVNNERISEITLKNAERIANAYKAVLINYTLSTLTHEYKQLVSPIGAAPFFDLGQQFSEFTQLSQENLYTETHAWAINLRQIFPPDEQYTSLLTKKYGDQRDRVCHLRKMHLGFDVIPHLPPIHTKDELLAVEVGTPLTYVHPPYQLNTHHLTLLGIYGHDALRLAQIKALSKENAETLLCFGPPFSVLQQPWFQPFHALAYVMGVCDAGTQCDLNEHQVNAMADFFLSREAVTIPNYSETNYEEAKKDYQKTKAERLKTDRHHTQFSIMQIATPTEVRQHIATIAIQPDDDGNTPLFTACNNKAWHEAITLIENDPDLLKMQYQPGKSPWQSIILNAEETPGYLSLLKYLTLQLKENFNGCTYHMKNNTFDTFMAGFAAWVPITDYFLPKFNDPIPYFEFIDEIRIIQTALQLFGQLNLEIGDQFGLLRRAVFKASGVNTVMLQADLLMIHRKWLLHHQTELFALMNKKFPDFKINYRQCAQVIDDLFHAYQPGEKLDPSLLANRMDRQLPCAFEIRTTVTGGINTHSINVLLLHDKARKGITIWLLDRAGYSAEIDWTSQKAIIHAYYSNSANSTAAFTAFIALAQTCEDNIHYLETIRALCNDIKMQPVLRIKVPLQQGLTCAYSSLETLYWTIVLHAITNTQTQSLAKTIEECIPLADDWVMFWKRFGILDNLNRQQNHFLPLKQTQTYQSVLSACPDLEQMGKQNSLFSATGNIVMQKITSNELCAYDTLGFHPALVSTLCDETQPDLQKHNIRCYAYSLGPALFNQAFSVVSSTPTNLSEKIQCVVQIKQKPNYTFTAFLGDTLSIDSASYWKILALQYGNPPSTLLKLSEEELIRVVFYGKLAMEYPINILNKLSDTQIEALQKGFADVHTLHASWFGAHALCSLQFLNIRNNTHLAQIDRHQVALIKSHRFPVELVATKPHIALGHVDIFDSKHAGAWNETQNILGVLTDQQLLAMPAAQGLGFSCGLTPEQVCRPDFTVAHAKAIIAGYTYEQAMRLPSQVLLLHEFEINTYKEKLSCNDWSQSELTWELLVIITLINAESLLSIEIIEKIFTLDAARQFAIATGWTTQEVTHARFSIFHAIGILINAPTEPLKKLSSNAALFFILQFLKIKNWCETEQFTAMNVAIDVVNISPLMVLAFFYGDEPLHRLRDLSNEQLIALFYGWTVTEVTNGNRFTKTHWDAARNHQYSGRALVNLSAQEVQTLVAQDCQATHYRAERQSYLALRAQILGNSAFFSRVARDGKYPSQNARVRPHPLMLEYK